MLLLFSTAQAGSHWTNWLTGLVSMNNCTFHHSIYQELYCIWSWNLACTLYCSQGVVASLTDDVIIFFILLWFYCFSLGLFCDIACFCFNLSVFLSVMYFVYNLRGCGEQKNLQLPTLMCQPHTYSSRWRLKLTALPSRGQQNSWMLWAVDQLPSLGTHCETRHPFGSVWL